MHQTRLFMAALGLALLGACGSDSGGSGTAATGGASGAPVLATVSGVVVDRAGVPVPGVTVSVFHHNTNNTVTTTTNASGMYSVTGLDTVNNADYAIYAQKAGLAFQPAVGDSAGVVTKFDFNGLYRTVIRFPSLPSHDVTAVNFTALRAGDRVAELPRTGQATSYASGDDASAHAGVAWPATRFTDNTDGTVTDHLTGLVWLKDAGCISPMAWATALTAASQLASGACGLTDGSAAGQWRMPNANELESLVDVSRSSPAVAAASPFIHIDLGAAYWTSTTYMALTANAMAIRFTDGRWINGADAGDGGFGNTKATVANSLWAVKSGVAGSVQPLATGVYAGVGGGSFGVRDDASLQLGAPLTASRFIDNGDGTVADTVTGLTWLKQADCINQPWVGALAAVNGLASGQCGLTDGSTAGQWRMPNRSEMLSLSDRAPTFPQASYFDGQYQGTSSMTGPVIFGNFMVSDYYWTSTTSAVDPTQAWTIYSCDFGVYNVTKTEMRYSLAVR